MPDHDEIMPRGRPDPDPTVLTTEALQREVANLKALLIDKVDGRHREQLAQATLTESQIKALQEIMEEKFSSVQVQFALVERQRIEQKEDTKAAVDAALIAQKDAVREQTIASEKSIAKSETATSKQLEEMSKTFGTAITGQATAHNDLKDRVNSIESRKAGGKEQTSAIYAFVGFIVTLLVLGGMLAAAGVFKQ